MRPTNDACPRCLSLQQELEALKARAEADLHGLTADLAAKNRKIGKLQKELEEKNDGDAGASEVRDLLEYARDTLGKGKRWYTKSDGKRYKVARLALDRHGMETCRKAVLGLSMRPFAGPRGRSLEQYPGSKRFDDLEYALKDEVTVERCCGYADEGTEPEPQAPESAPSPVRPAAGRTYRYISRDPLPGVLTALERAGSQVWTQRVGFSWKANCPCAHRHHHGDANPSLIVSIKHNGWVDLKCWSQDCPLEEILNAIGLENKDLAPDERFPDPGLAQQREFLEGRAREDELRARREQMWSDAA